MQDDGNENKEGVESQKLRTTVPNVHIDSFGIYSGPDSLYAAPCAVPCKHALIQTGLLSRV
jgi:hypothetical protein